MLACLLCCVLRRVLSKTPLDDGSRERRAIACHEAAVLFNEVLNAHLERESEQRQGRGLVVDRQVPRVQKCRPAVVTIEGEATARAAELSVIVMPYAPKPHRKDFVDVPQQHVAVAVLQGSVESRFLAPVCWLVLRPGDVQIVANLIASVVCDATVPIRDAVVDARALEALKLHRALDPPLRCRRAACSIQLYLLRATLMKTARI